MKSALTLLTAMILAGCSEKPVAPPASGQSPTNIVTKTFEVRGVIREIPAGGQTLVVRHEDIPGYMPKMTMELNVRDTNEVHNLQRDDEITFRLVATDDTHWIENIRRVGHAATTNATVVPPVEAHLVRELEPGDVFPDAELLDEHERAIRFSQFRGQAVAFSFFFTRCPLPDFCPLMNKNFSAARRALTADKNGATNWMFLSVSFDAEFDSPAMLAGYATSYRGDDPSHWLFASASPATMTSLAPQIDFMFARDNGGFSHNLRTVVLDAQGRIQHVFTGNKWSNTELVEEMKSAMQAKP